MLYITTRNKVDSHTAYHTLSKDRNSDGGAFVPFQIPKLSEEELYAFKEKSFGQCVADILNLFFPARLDGWDVDFCIGRNPVKLVSMSHKIIVAETWHNPDHDFARLVRNLSGRMRGIEDTTGTPSNWAWIAVRIAVLFGLFGELDRNGIIEPEQRIDISVAAGDFSSPMAVWYARAMGLPIGTIICSCDENSMVWDLFHHGELRTDTAPMAMNTPAADSGVPADLERLIFATLGVEEVCRYRSACDNGKVYTLDADKLSRLRQGMFAAVVSQKRMESVINSVYKTRTYLLGPCSALAYGGLQDYRAGTGETRGALILTERSPVCSAATVSRAVGITAQELIDRTSML